MEKTTKITLNLTNEEISEIIYIIEKGKLNTPFEYSQKFASKLQSKIIKEWNKEKK